MKKINLPKIDGSTLLKVTLTGLTVLSAVLTLKSEAIDREAMKKEIIEELGKKS